MSKVEKVGSQTIVRDEESGEFEQGTTVPDSSTLARVRKNMQIREYLDEHALELMDKAIDLAKIGDPQMIKLCLDKILPNKKYDTVKIQMYGQVSRMNDVLKMSGSILKSVCDGMISPEQAKIVCDILDMHASNIEKQDLIGRLDDIERMLETYSCESKIEHLESEL